MIDMIIWQLKTVKNLIKNKKGVEREALLWLMLFIAFCLAALIIIWFKLGPKGTNLVDTLLSKIRGG